METVQLECRIELLYFVVSVPYDHKKHKWATITPQPNSKSFACNMQAVCENYTLAERPEAQDLFVIRTQSK